MNAEKRILRDYIILLLFIVAFPIVVILLTAKG